jgi:L-asparaginase
MAYTAFALSIGLENLNKPVVLTGSQIPGCELNSDAPRNLINAIILAQQPICGVYILFDERIISGARATKISEYKLDAYSTVNETDIGENKVDLQLHEKCFQKVKNQLVVHKGFHSDIFVYQITPGCDPSDLLFLLNEKKYNGIILRGYRTGNIPQNFAEFFEKAEKKDFPIIVSTQCLNGMTSIGIYESGNWFTKYKNFIDGFDQSIETLTVKLQHALFHSADIQTIKSIIHKNYCGEINEKYIH